MTDDLDDDLVPDDPEPPSDGVQDDSVEDPAVAELPAPAGD